MKIPTKCSDSRNLLCQTDGAAAAVRICQQFGVCEFGFPTQSQWGVPEIGIRPSYMAIMSDFLARSSSAAGRPRQTVGSKPLLRLWKGKGSSSQTP